ncbi:PREDICTED: gastrin/cholecystokinin-like peptide [Gekko japonicus]|uniref:Gastrin/cholecystokinin-like peptide n=1 Tax=Gekko japonicus TaxID=146911 RepID=A0ABM1KW97_GEKJA|nr:PREDICTED: gastrin/cholecystokinin-like peptide [Gekko japonicus]
MHPKVFACLLLATLIATGLSRSTSASRQGEGRSNKQRTAVPGPERTQKSDGRWIVRREWPGGLSRDQKHLISQFLPHIYAAELSGKENSVQMNDDLQSHDYPTWMDWGRRSLKDVNEDA